MNSLELAFNFESASVRTITDGEEIWFVGKDVCDVLGFTNSRKAIDDHVEPEDKIVFEKSRFVTFDAPNRGLTVINESGVYALILSSNLPSAKQFKHWVTHDVLPSIRKQGFYSLLPDEELMKMLEERIRHNPRLLKDSAISESNKAAMRKWSLETNLADLWARRDELTLEEYLNELGRLNPTTSRWSREAEKARQYYERKPLKEKALRDAKRAAEPEPERTNYGHGIILIRKEEE